ncbi:site-specific DNA-methyltransferase [Thiobacillus denitrificans]|uniref:site-specific DNA-methyltransferase n=1 Tax=Thiobacillus denitrificans TaxID=36861 RepID=UPI00038205A4|nr:site-specific DNA-methyltransferase [Thiobacillus denitrificans]
MSDPQNDTNLATSANPADERRAQLAALIPDAFTEGKLDVAALKRALGEAAVIESGERYALTWAGKANAYKVLQTPSTATLRPERDKSVNFDDAQHVFIEGENLEVLKVLQKAYFGKVKLIYIDPPYNTGSDSFIYPDRFQESKEDYLRRLNELDDDGTLMREGFFRKNSKENGHYHSNWLSMMLPRLYIARNLLREDGVIFVSCDDNEVHNLRGVMNEVFGEENFIAQMVWEGASKNTADQIGVNHEYVLVFARFRSSVPKVWALAKDGVAPILREVERLKLQHGDDFDAASNDLAAWYRANKATPSFANRRFRYIDKNGVYKEDDPTAPGGRKFKLINPKTGAEIPLRANRGWAFDQVEFSKLVEQQRISFISSISIMVRRYLHETDTLTPQSVFYQPARSASERLEKFLGGSFFDYPKDDEVIRQFVEMATDSNDESCIAMDFFAGSATTSHAVLEQNSRDGGQRRFVAIQLPEPVEDETIQKAGFSTIADIARARISKAIQHIASKADLATPPQLGLGFKSFRLTPSNFKQWRGDFIDTPEQLAEQIQLFAKGEKEDAQVEDMFYELLLKFGQELTTPVETLEVEDGKVFAIHERKMLFVLESFAEAMIDPLVAMKPREIIVIDGVFQDSDMLKSNLDLQCRDAGIRFTCI